MKHSKIHTKINASCQHCGEECNESEAIIENSLHFCCFGCATIYKWLHQEGKFTRGKLHIPNKEKFAYLDSESIQDLLIQYSDNEQTVVDFSIPKIHCSSCILILEKLSQLDLGIISSRLNYGKKILTVRYDPSVISMRKIVEVLDYMGYPPHIHYQKNGTATNSTSKYELTQIGIAGFVFGNVMLMSFPGYLGLDNLHFEKFFGLISIALCIPLMAISAIDYLKSGISSLLHRTLNLDVSISIGILTLFIKSVYDIVYQISPGYLDSLSGFVLFLLIGKMIQKWTYQHVSFDKEYQDFFPLHTTIIKGENKIYIPLSEVKVGDILLIKNADMIPGDGIIEAMNSIKVDYSFVTGESEPVQVISGEKVYAGGVNMGTSAQLLISKAIDQTYLTGLWAEESFGEIKSIDKKSILDKAGKYFTSIILVIALSTLAYWTIYNPSIAINTFASVLIIACPCVLALSIPFSFGSMRNLLAKRNLFFRNTEALEALHRVDDFIFDKTGTLTKSTPDNISFKGEINSQEKTWIRSLVAHSSHPLSRAIEAELKDFPLIPLDNVNEKTGFGISGNIGSHHIQLGSAEFVQHQPISQQISASCVYLKINDQIKGAYYVKTPLKTGIAGLLQRLGDKFNLHLISGDNDRQRFIFSQWIGLNEENIHFNQSPYDKLNYIKSLQAKGLSTCMIGDGLNDSGALKQSDLAIAVRDELHNFSPATDVIIPSDALIQLPSLINISRQLKYVMYVMYGFSILYNCIGLVFAVQGLLSPIVAAILMPISSVTIVTLGSLSTWIIYKKQLNFKT